MKRKLLILACLLLCTGEQILAKDVYNINGNNYSYLFNIYQSSDMGITFLGEDVKSPFNITKNYLRPLFVSAQNWANIIRPLNNSSNPVSYEVFALDDWNAAAASIFVDVQGSPYRVTAVNAAINNLVYSVPEIFEDTPQYTGLIVLGYGVNPSYPGWAPFSGNHSLYHGEIPDLNVVLMHEIMHSLGITSAANTYQEEDLDETYYFSESKTAPISIFDSNLRVYKGDTAQLFNPNLEITPQSGMAIGEGKEFDIIKHSPYFVGENTIKVLGGKADYDSSKQAIIDNGGLVNYSESYDRDARPSVYGLPIHPYDGEDDEIEIDLSHLELRNSYMSHQAFRNWMIPMEVELAVLKDVGYDIDLRRHFGKSYYLNNITDTFTTGYSEWDGSAYTGNPSTVTQGVGLHIYGDNNNITQASDILTLGEGSIGVRIDGEGNTYTLNSGNNILTNGKDNLGIAVTWGQNHKINVEQGSTVQASGEDGIAVSFDFGAGIFGTNDAVRGSYINYDSLMEFDISPESSTTHALVDEFNVAGTLEGEKAAIYISDNAHVENINILDGANIKGDIISDWNSISSGPNAKVQKEGQYIWTNVDPNDESEIYFTNINIDNNFSGTIDGNIDGNNGIYNTLKLNNFGNTTVNGKHIFVNTINNTGNINVNEVELDVQNGKISGNGNINVDYELKLDSSVKQIDNTIKLSENSTLSTINDSVSEININSIDTNNAKISFDLGDKYVLGTNSNNNTASISQIKVDQNTADKLSTTNSFELFETNANTQAIDLGSSEANIYYKGNRYTITQNSSNKDILDVNKTATGMELKDAAEDPTSANYIVTEQKLTKDAGRVNGDYFEISGNSINVNGNKGLVVDKANNKNGTVLKTDIFGASDSDLTVKNGGILSVEAENRDIIIGSANERAITLSKGSVELDAGNNNIIILGDIKGSNNQKDLITSKGTSVMFNGTNNVSISAQNTITTIAGTSKNTIWNLESNILNVSNDSYLSSNGTNQININKKGVISLQNDNASDIELSKMTLNSDLYTTIDIDFKKLNADKFVFKNSSDLETNDNLLYLTDAKFLNADRAILSDKRYVIPFISKKYHNDKFLGSVVSDIKSKNLLTPIFKYNFDYEETQNMIGFTLNRGNSSNYRSYNPAVMAAPIAAQVGGYLTQLNSYDEAFRNLDMKMLLTREERQAYKMANLYASTTQPTIFSEIYLPEKDSAGWFRPYASFETVGLKNGPKVGNNMYGSFFGGDSQMYETKNGWDYQYSAYVGYNGSHQYYSGNSIYQNGGHFGLTGIWYKNDFFTALTANVGASVAEASTMYGNEDFPMLMTGIASKTGYNWELAKGKFIIQPSYLMSYSFVNTFDYTNAAGVRINSDPLHAINITPGLKFIGNLKHGWQPYLGVQMVWNIMDKTDFQAQNVSLPYMSVKPYVQYGVGLQKRWGERFTGFGQVMLRNGGRNGVALNAGFRWSLGKGSDNKKTSYKKTVIK